MLSSYFCVLANQAGVASKIYNWLVSVLGNDGYGFLRYFLWVAMLVILIILLGAVIALATLVRVPFLMIAEHTVDSVGNAGSAIASAVIIIGELPIVIFGTKVSNAALGPLVALLTFAFLGCILVGSLIIAWRKIRD